VFPSKITPEQFFTGSIQFFVVFESVDFQLIPGGWTGYESGYVFNFGVTIMVCTPYAPEPFMLTDFEGRKATCPEGKKHIRISDAGSLYLQV